MSFNVRGLVGSLKINSLKRMINNHKPSVILFKETMLEGIKAHEVLEKILKYWSFTHINADGHSGGLTKAWSLALKESKICKLDNVLKTVLKDNTTGEAFAILNVYRPYHNCRTFWENIASSQLWEDRNMVIGGDLNLTVS